MAAVRRSVLLTRSSYWLVVAGLALAYLATAKLGLSMALVSRQVSPVWPPTGLALAAVLLLGHRVWPGIFAGALIANATAGEPLLTALAIAGGNTLEAVAGVWLVTRRPFRSRLDGFLDALSWVVLAAGVATAVAATVGVLSLCAGGVQPWSRFGALWGVWWLGDALGALVVGSLLVTWLSPAPPEATPSRGTLRTELPVIAIGAVTVALLVFLRRTPAGMAAGPTLEYTAFPFLVWAGLRCGPRGASLVAFLVSLVAIAGTLRSDGPFAGAAVHAGLVLLQTYMAVVAATGLLLAAAIAERDRLDERKNEFLAMLGHELRNPLGAMTNALAVLAERPAAPVAERMVQILSRQARHLARLVDDLLDVSRITRGTLPLSTEVVDLREIVGRAVEMAQPWMSEREHELRVSIPEGPVPVRGDAVRLEQVIANLLHNAAKYTPPRGHIEVRAERSAREAVVAVRDDGVGMSGELLPHVFELFVQAERSLARAQGGLGLGLTLVRRIVELHGGRVTASSDGPDRGSEVVVRLPLATTAEGVVSVGEPLPAQ